MQLHELTWPDVVSYLDRSRGIIIPMGSTEQHGPTGLIGTDTICAEVIARGVGDRTDALVAPTIAYSQAQFNLSFPGTVSVRARTFMRLVTDIIESLASQGFTHFYCLNAHGANVAPVRSAFQDIHADRSLGRGDGGPLRCRLRSWWEPEPVASLRETLFAKGEGLHATPSEISITQAILPDAARKAELAAAPPLAPDLRDRHAGDNHLDADSHRAMFPDGRVGSDPSLADRVQGDRLIETAVAALADDYLRFLDE